MTPQINDIYINKTTGREVIIVAIEGDVVFYEDNKTQIPLYIKRFLKMFKRAENDS